MPHTHGKQALRSATQPLLRRGSVGAAVCGVAGAGNQQYEPSRPVSRPRCTKR